MGGVSILNPKRPISLIVCMYGGGVHTWLRLPMEARRQTVVLSCGCEYQSQVLCESRVCPELLSYFSSHHSQIQDPFYSKAAVCWIWWLLPVIPELRNQLDQEFKASLSYIWSSGGNWATWDYCLNNNKKGCYVNLIFGSSFKKVYFILLSLHSLVWCIRPGT